jgi:hypothetical protein
MDLDWNGVSWVSEKKNHQHIPFCELLIFKILLLKVGGDLKQVNWLEKDIVRRFCKHKHDNINFFFNWS